MWKTWRFYTLCTDKYALSASTLLSITIDVPPKETTVKGISKSNYRVNYKNWQTDYLCSESPL